MAQINSDYQSQRQCNCNGYCRGEQRTCDERHDAEMFLSKQRSPLGVGKEIPKRYFLEEAERLPEQYNEYPHGGKEREQGTGLEEPLNDTFRYFVAYAHNVGLYR